MVTFWGILVVLGVLATARRETGRGTEVDPATPTPDAEPTWLGRLIAHHERAWEVHDRAMRPWEAPVAGPDPLRPRC